MTSLKSLNAHRQGSFRKDSRDENFFLEMNRVLQVRERALYEDLEITHPFIFIFGAPRSGTTLLSQLLAYSLDVGFINNLAARFWLAPLHGIRLSRSILSEERAAAFRSEYARTRELADIHEFGYFWRDLLNKETLEDVTRAAEREADIDWWRVRTVLANIQHEFRRPVVFKNIFGAYHLKKMKAVLGKVVYLFIERDPLDTALSILDARRKYYRDVNTWWSYAPVEYDLLKDRDYHEQIAGQVFFLRRYYRREIARHAPECSMTISYEKLCRSPGKILTEVTALAKNCYDADMIILNEPPDEFPLRIYTDRDAEKATFRKLIRQFETDYDDD